MRPPLEYQLAGMGQTCMELRLRALECGGDSIHIQSVSFPREQCDRSAGSIRRHNVVRSADCLAFVRAEELASYPVRLREVVRAGEPLNPEVIERVRTAWGLTIRDGYGQTETTAMIGNTPGQLVKPGGMGRSLPGYRVALLDSEGRSCDEGEICIDLSVPPLGLMQGYLDDSSSSMRVGVAGYYHAGDVASCDPDGYITCVGRKDDVFKSSDYRLSPFELESALIEHPAIAEAAVVPSPHPVRLSVPKAFVVLRPGYEANRQLALDLFVFIRARLAAYKRVRRLEFSDLPKTISGKIRRTELRAIEQDRNPGERKRLEFFDGDFCQEEIADAMQRRSD